ncbi:hypothetical protein [Hymenobacter rubidus]|uniref:hypothetical protein n=1 Tax=Hymenobacter rubidus TaxID=1441626 RepID=UPI00191FAFF4|nr:hypothetical protein [Hymenobacter rubidus]
MNTSEEKSKLAMVYLAYGLESGKYQAILSIYTLCHHIGANINDFLIVIYTDSSCALFDKYLTGLPVKLEIISREQIKQFRGPDDFVFRIKPLILKEFFLKYKCNLLYVDTDTYFLHNPMPLFQNIKPGYSIMNIEEYNFVDAGPIEPIHWFSLRQALKRYKYSIGGQEVTIPIATMMWNAGIIGISYKDCKLVDSIIELTDEIYSKCSAFIVEQFATSYILQTHTTVKSTENYIEHYWIKGLKNVFNIMIPRFLKQNSDKSGRNLYEAAFNFALSTVQLPHLHTEPLVERIKKRMKLIIKVARKGHL